ncbi:uncharacterized protein LOC134726248 [Mytilus trossulus]|uniref:uncharacterized protein LOC134726248 n=1 Tax=Mytilus trossulus TaxID=6551 RepID=UPI003004ECBF
MKAHFFVFPFLLFLVKSKEIQGFSDGEDKGVNTTFTWFISQGLTQLGTQLNKLQTMTNDEQVRLGKVEENVANLKTKIEDRISQANRVILSGMQSDIQKLKKRSEKDKGFVGGSSYSGSGPTNNLCVPNEPQWGIYDNKVNDSPFIGAALFDHWDIDIKNTLFDKKYSYYAIQCAVCDLTQASSTVMIPGRKTCYDNWRMEYTGYLMASHPSHTDLEYICVDGNPDHIKKIPSWSNKSLLLSVYSKCNGATPCPPYVEGREMTCVVCSK